jgi:flagellar protein FliO/FliZ
MVVGLAVVIGVIYGLSWVLKQVRASKEGNATGAGLAPISSLPLGPGKSVHLVRVGRELVLLGAAEKGVVPIRTYHEDEARAAGLLDSSSEGPSLRGPKAEMTVSPARPAGVVEMLRKLTVRR